jgi:uncharacterized membrane protein YhaH (DUF805 family)
MQSTPKHSFLLLLLPLFLLLLLLPLLALDIKELLDIRRRGGHHSRIKHCAAGS